VSQIIKNNTASGGGPISMVNMVVLAAGSGVYTPSSGMKYVWVRAIAGAGASGGTPATSISTVAVGGPGGSACYGESVYSAATLGATVSYTVGAGGVAVSGAAGGAGGNTTFGSFFTLGGGGGGAASTAGTAVQANGGVGGTLISGSVQIEIAGTSGMYSTGITSPVDLVTSGFGPYSALGLGGPPSTGNFPGEAGTGYGSGPSGPTSENNIAKTGINGQPGVIIIMEYI